MWTFSLGWGEANANAVSPDHGFAVAGRTVSVDGDVNHEWRLERFTVVKFADTSGSAEAEQRTASSIASWWRQRMIPR